MTSVIFIKTTVMGIDRGWDPTDVIALLTAEGIATRVTKLDTLDELNREIDESSNALFWPVCYSLAGDPDGNLIAEVFENRKVRFVGASPSSLKFSSKIQIKRAIDRISGVNTPSYILLDASGAGSQLARVDFPVMLKTEFSCNSEGVRKVDSFSDFDEAFTELSSMYGQRMYVEHWERSKEYTAAYIPNASGEGGAIAPVCMRILSGASYIDIPTKAESPLVEIVSLDNSEVSEIQAVVGLLVRELPIDGHCRIDLLRNSRGKLFVIEANFQPFMSIPEHKRSYFPNALQRALGIGFRDQVYRIILHALNRRLS